MHRSNPCYSTVFSQLQLDFVPALFSLQLLVFFPGSIWVLSQVQPGNCPSFLWCMREHFLSKLLHHQCFYSVLDKGPACDLLGPGFNYLLGSISFCFTTASQYVYTVIIFEYFDYVYLIKLLSSNLGKFPAIAGNCPRFN